MKNRGSRPTVERSSFLRHRGPVWASAAAMLLLAGGAALAQQPPTASGLPTRIDNELAQEVIEDRSRSVYHLVEPGYLVTSYDNQVGALGRRVPYNAAIRGDAPSDLRVIVFTSTELMQGLSRRTSQELSRQLDAGEIIVCAEGLGRDIKAALDRLDPALAETGSTRGGDAVLVCLFESPAGYTAELSIAAPGRDEDSLFGAFRQIRDWYDRNQDDPDHSTPIDETQDHAMNRVLAPTSWWEWLLGSRTASAQSSSGAWDALYTFENSGYTTGTFAGAVQTAGTHKFTITVYNLASDDLGFDWYRLDFQTISEISNYEMTGDKFGDTSGKCGWWTEEVVTAITINTPRGQWWDYMPDTTVGSTTTGFSIGGNITTSQAGISAAYSMSYGTSDVTITVEADSVAQTIEWKAELRGCGNYEWYPDYRGASDAAKTTYNLNPSLIVAVPTGSLLDVFTATDDTWGFTVRKDQVSCDFACAGSTTDPSTASHAIGVAIQCTQETCN